MKIDVDVPISIRLRMDQKKVVAAGARRMARILKEYLRAGRAGDGKALVTKSPRPLYRTGQLVESIEADRPRNTKNGPISAVRPLGFHAILVGEQGGKRKTKKLGRIGRGRGGVARERPANRMIMAALQKRMGRQIIALSPEMQSQIQGEMRAEIERQIASGTLRLEFRNLRGGL